MLGLRGVNFIGLPYGAYGASVAWLFRRRAADILGPKDKVPGFAIALFFECLLVMSARDLGLMWRLVCRVPL